MELNRALVVGAGDRDCALTFATTNAATIATKNTIAVAFTKFIFPPITLTDRMPGPVRLANIELTSTTWS